MTGEIEQPSIVAYLAVRDGLDAIAFYQRAFDATLLNQKMADDGKRVLHAVLDVFGTMVMLSDEFPEYGADVMAPATVGGTTFTLHVEFDEPQGVDAAMAKAIAAGCTVTWPAQDTFWGMRYGRLKDPFGHAWAFGAALPG